MAVTFSNQGAGTGGSTSASVPYPTVAAGDMMILAIANKYPPTEPSIPAGWTLVGQKNSGAGSAGVDSGNTYISVFSKIADGTETGNLSVTIPSGNSAACRMSAWTKETEAGWAAPTMVKAAFSTPATAVVASFTGLDLRANDAAIVFFATNNNDQTFSGQTISATGCVFSAPNKMVEFGTAIGDDCKLVAVRAAVTEGATSSSVNFGITASASDANSPAGPLLLVRLRESGSPENRISIRRKNVVVFGAQRLNKKLPSRSPPSGHYRKRPTPDMDELLGRKPRY